MYVIMYVGMYMYILFFYKKNYIYIGSYLHIYKFFFHHLNLSYLF